MEIISVKTKKLLPPKDDLFDVLEKTLSDVQDGDVIFFTSKVVSIHQGRCIKTEDIEDRERLIDDESDAVLRPKCQEGITIGLKHAMVNPFGGIDESNGNAYTILTPKDPNVFAKDVHDYLTTRFKLTALGVVIVDSTFLPMRAGSVTLSIASYGLEVLRDYRNKKDIFARVLKMTQINVVDSLAAFAGIYLGEGDEQTPVVILRNLPNVEFTNESRHDTLTKLPFGDSFCAFLSLFKKSKEK